MIYNEITKDLFTVSDDYWLAHCISADFGMNAGIAVEFNRRFNMRNILRNKYPNYLSTMSKYFDEDPSTGGCILEGRVFNLITKKYYYMKPNYQSITSSLKCMKMQAEKDNITKIALPLIGCGLDKLSWNKVSDIIREVFDDSNIEILVCNY